jgi:RNA polymerase sigma factor (sigma-70 family)
MHEIDTVSGGSQEERFPTTLWPTVLAAADGSAPGTGDALNWLAEHYWRPVYAYVRTAWRKHVEDAKDLTQAFFTHLLQKQYLTRLRPQGSFRGYLKRALKHFLIGCERASAVRRPEGSMLSIEMSSGELERLEPQEEADTPEQVYDRTWRRCLIMSAVEDLLARLAAAGKSAYADVFRVYCLNPDAAMRGAPEPTYRDIAVRLGLQEHDVRNYLSTCRAMLRELLRERVRQTVTTDEDVDAELAALLGKR